MGVSAAGNQEAVQFLIKAAGDRKREYINAKSSMSESALGFALFAEKMDVAKYLVDNGADIYMPYTDKKRNIDYTYLIMAAILANLIRL